jgi:hypothetical protein
MGRRLTAAQQQRKATIALARETAIRTRPPNTLTTVRARPIDAVVYRSQLIKEGTQSAKFIVQASTPAIAKFGGLAALGLQAPESITDPVSPKPRGFIPAQIQYMEATATPTASTTSWGSRVIKYSAATVGNAQAHYLCPISGLTTNVTYDAVDTRANTIFRVLVPAPTPASRYARFYLKPERFNASKN